MSLGGDYVKMFVEVEGSETYKSTMNSELAVPKFTVDIIDVTYSPR